MKSPNLYSKIVPEGSGGAEWSTPVEIEVEQGDDDHSAVRKGGPLLRDQGDDDHSVERKGGTGPTSLLRGHHQRSQ